MGWGKVEWCKMLDIRNLMFLLNRLRDFDRFEIVSTSLSIPPDLIISLQGKIGFWNLGLRSANKYKNKGIKSYLI